MAQRGIKSAINRDGVRTDRLVLHPATTSPAFPTMHVTPTAAPTLDLQAGDFYFSTSNQLMFHNGTAFAPVGSTVLDPMMFGAAGDASADDTAELQAMIDTVDSYVSSVAEPRVCVLDGRGRSYRITGTLNFNGLKHAIIKDFVFRVDGTLADTLLFKGLTFSTLSNILVQGHDGGSFGDTTDYVFRFERDATYGVHTMNRLINCRAVDIKCKHAFAFGVNSTSNQVDNTQLFGCIAYGNNSASSVDTTWWQNGFLFGSGTSGNILNYDCFGCISNKFRYGVTNSSTNVRWFGGSSENSENAFRHGGAGSFLISGQRNETCQRFYESISSGDVAPIVTMQGIEFHGNALAADDDWILWKTSGVLHLIDIDFRNITNTPQVNLSNNGVGKTLLWDGCIAPFAPKDSHNIAGTDFTVIWRAWDQIDASGLYVASFPEVHLGEAPMQWSVGTSAPDTSLYRRTSTGVLYVPGYLESTAGFQSTDAASSLQQSFRSRVTGDTQYRHYTEASGRHQWGSGSAAVDTNLYREGADILATDDKLHVVGELELDGALNHDGSTVGFYGVAPTTRPTALTAANASALNTGDATSDTVIGNMRTRIGEIEAKLQALGLLS